jgi:hypothetical protein
MRVKISHHMSNYILTYLPNSCLRSSLSLSCRRYSLSLTEPNFITLLTTAPHWTILQATKSSAHYHTKVLNIYLNIILTSKPHLPSGHFLADVPNTVLYSFLSIM